MPKKCLVILSGGQDSTTCAAIARRDYDEVHSITFNYGQRHLVELQAATAIASALNFDSHEIIDLGPVLKGASPLVSSNAVGKYNDVESLPTGVEPTFVYGRNLLFLTIAANRAAVLGLTDVFTGVCQEDNAGYYDCTQPFIDQAQAAIGEAIAGNKDHLKIITPLMDLTKAESVLLAKEALGTRFEEVMGLTHTCYDGVLGGCGKCHACLLRERGFKEAGIEDPIKTKRIPAVA